MLPEKYHNSVGERLEVVVSMDLAASYFTEGNLAKHLHNTIKNEYAECLSQALVNITTRSVS